MKPYIITETLMQRMRRWIALLTCVIFLQTSLFSSSPAQAAPPTQAAFPVVLLSFDALQIPAEIGKVDDTFTGTSDFKVIVVQDAHAIPDAQRSIRKAILYFHQKYGVNLIALEGASAKLDARMLKSFPDKERLNKVLGEYFDQGELAGGTAAAISGITAEDNSAAGTSLDFQGVEDWPVYEEALGLYLAAMGQEKNVLKEVESQKSKVESEKQKKYSPELLKVDGVINAFREDKSDFMKTLAALAEMKAPEKGSELELLFQEAKSEGEDQTGAEVEVRKIAEKLRVASRQSSVAGEKQKEFEQKYQGFQTGQLTAKAFALFLREFLEASPVLYSRLKAEDFRHRGDGGQARLSASLTRLSGSEKRMRSIEGTKLFSDFESYAQSVKESLFTSDAVRELDREDRKLWLLTKLAKLELSYEDWTEIAASALGLLAMTKKGEPPETLSLRSAVGGEAISELFKPHFAFYQNAQKRDDIFYTNLQKLLQANERQVTSDDPRHTALLVAGGFHAHGLCSLLKEHGISYALVMPEIKNLPEHSHYRQHMQGNVSWKNYFEVKDGKVNLYNAFIRGTRDRLIGSSRESSVVSREQNQGLSPLPQGTVPSKPQDPRLLKNWRDQIIRDLADEGRIEKAGEYTRFIDELTGEGRDQAVRKRLKQVEQFLAGLKRLDAEGKFNAPNIAKLFPAATAQMMAGGPAGLSPVSVASENLLRSAELPARTERVYGQAASEVRAPRETASVRPEGRDRTAKSEMRTTQPGTASNSAESLLSVADAIAEARGILTGFPPELAVQEIEFTGSTLAEVAKKLDVLLVNLVRGALNSSVTVQSPALTENVSQRIGVLMTLAQRVRQDADTEKIRRLTEGLRRDVLLEDNANLLDMAEGRTAKNIAQRAYQQVVDAKIGIIKSAIGNRVLGQSQKDFLKQLEKNNPVRFAHGLISSVSGPVRFEIQSSSQAYASYYGTLPPEGLNLPGNVVREYYILRRAEQMLLNWLVADAWAEIEKMQFLPRKVTPVSEISAGVSAEGISLGGNRTPEERQVQYDDKPIAITLGTTVLLLAENSKGQFVIWHQGNAEPVTNKIHIGNRPQAGMENIILDDAEASGSHLTISVSGNVITFSDLGSLNGSKIQRASDKPADLFLLNAAGLSEYFVFNQFQQGRVSDVAAEAEKAAAAYQELGMTAKQEQLAQMARTARHLLSIKALYRSLRLGTYSLKESGGTRALSETAVAAKQSNATIDAEPADGWNFRTPKYLNARDQDGIPLYLKKQNSGGIRYRVSANVKASPELIAALDDLLGRKIVKGYYKVGNEIDWLQRHDTLTIYLDEDENMEHPVTRQRITDDLTRVLGKHIRSRAKQFDLLGTKIAHGLAWDTTPTAEQLTQTIEQARTIHPDIGRAVEIYFGKNLNASSGQFEAAKKFLQQQSTRSEVRSTEAPAEQALDLNQLKNKEFFKDREERRFGFSLVDDTGQTQRLTIVYKRANPDRIDITITDRVGAGLKFPFSFNPSDGLLSIRGVTSGELKKKHLYKASMSFLLRHVQRIDIDDILEDEFTQWLGSRDERKLSHSEIAVADSPLMRGQNVETDRNVIFANHLTTRFSMASIRIEGDLARLFHGAVRIEKTLKRSATPNRQAVTGLIQVFEKELVKVRANGVNFSNKSESLTREQLQLLVIKNQLERLKVLRDQIPAGPLTTRSEVRVEKFRDPVVLTTGLELASMSEVGKWLGGSSERFTRMFLDKEPRLGEFISAAGMLKYEVLVNQIDVADGAAGQWGLTIGDGNTVGYQEFNEKRHLRNSLFTIHNHPNGFTLPSPADLLLVKPGAIGVILSSGQNKGVIPSITLYARPQLKYATPEALEQALRIAEVDILRRMYSTEDAGRHAIATAALAGVPALGLLQPSVLDVPTTVGEIFARYAYEVQVPIKVILLDKLDPEDLEGSLLEFVEKHKNDLRVIQSSQDAELLGRSISAVSRPGLPAFSKAAPYGLGAIGLVKPNWSRTWFGALTSESSTAARSEMRSRILSNESYLYRVDPETAAQRSPRERVLDYFNRWKSERSFRMHPEEVAALVQSGLTEDQIRSAAAEAGFQMPVMDKTGTEFEILQDYLIQIAKKVYQQLKTQEGSLANVLFFARDGDILFDAAVMLLVSLGEYDALKNRLTYFPVGNNIKSTLALIFSEAQSTKSESVRQRFYEALRAFYAQYGITRDVIEQGKTLTTLDAGFYGSIPKMIEEQLRVLYAEAAALRGKRPILAAEVVSNHPHDRRAFAREVGLTFPEKLDADEIQAQFQKSTPLTDLAALTLNDQSSFEIDRRSLGIDPRALELPGNPLLETLLTFGPRFFETQQPLEESFREILAVSLQVLPKSFGSFTMKEDAGHLQVRLEPVGENDIQDNVDVAGSFNDSIINPVAELVLQFRLAQKILSLQPDSALAVDQTPPGRSEVRARSEIRPPLDADRPQLFDSHHLSGSRRVRFSGEMTGPVDYLPAYLEATVGRDIDILSNHSEDVAAAEARSATFQRISDTLLTNSNYKDRNLAFLALINAALPPEFQTQRRELFRHVLFDPDRRLRHFVGRTGFSRSAADVPAAQWIQWLHEADAYLPFGSTVEKDASDKRTSATEKKYDLSEQRGNGQEAVLWGLYQHKDYDGKSHEFDLAISQELRSARWALLDSGQEPIIRVRTSLARALRTAIQRLVNGNPGVPYEEYLKKPEGMPASIKTSWRIEMVRNLVPFEENSKDPLIQYVYQDLLALKAKQTDSPLTSPARSAAAIYPGEPGTLILRAQEIRVKSQYPITVPRKENRFTVFGMDFALFNARAYPGLLIDTDIASACTVLGVQAEKDGEVYYGLGHIFNDGLGPPNLSLWTQMQYIHDQMTENGFTPTSYFVDYRDSSYQPEPAQLEEEVRRNLPGVKVSFYARALAAGQISDKFEVTPQGITVTPHNYNEPTEPTVVSWEAIAGTISKSAGSANETPPLRSEVRTQPLPDQAAQAVFDFNLNQPLLPGAVRFKKSWGLAPSEEGDTIRRFNEDRIAEFLDELNVPEGLKAYLFITVGALVNEVHYGTGLLRDLEFVPDRSNLSKSKLTLRMTTNDGDKRIDDIAVGELEARFQLAKAIEGHEKLTAEQIPIVAPSSTDHYQVLKMLFFYLILTLHEERTAFTKNDGEPGFLTVAYLATNAMGRLVPEPLFRLTIDDFNLTAAERNVLDQSSNLNSSTNILRDVGVLAFSFRETFRTANEEALGDKNSKESKFLKQTLEPLWDSARGMRSALPSGDIERVLLDARLNRRAVNESEITALQQQLQAVTVQANQYIEDLLDTMLALEAGEDFGLTAYQYGDPVPKTIWEYVELLRGYGFQQDFDGASRSEVRLFDRRTFLGVAGLAGLGLVASSFFFGSRRESRAARIERSRERRNSGSAIPERAPWERFSLEDSKLSEVEKVRQVLLTTVDWLVQGGYGDPDMLDEYAAYLSTAQAVEMLGQTPMDKSYDQEKNDVQIGLNLPVLLGLARGVAATTSPDLFSAVLAPLVLREAAGLRQMLYAKDHLKKLSDQVSAFEMQRRAETGSLEMSLTRPAFFRFLEKTENQHKIKGFALDYLAFEYLEAVQEFNFYRLAKSKNVYSPEQAKRDLVKLRSSQPNIGRFVAQQVTSSEILQQTQGDSFEIFRFQLMGVTTSSLRRLKQGEMTRVRGKLPPANFLAVLYAAFSAMQRFQATQDKGASSEGLNPNIISIAQSGQWPESVTFTAFARQLWPDLQRTTEEIQGSLPRSRPRETDQGRKALRDSLQRTQDAVESRRRGLETGIPSRRPPQLFDEEPGLGTDQRSEVRRIETVAEFDEQLSKTESVKDQLKFLIPLLLVNEKLPPDPLNYEAISAMDGGEMAWTIAWKSRLKLFEIFDQAASSSVGVEALRIADELDATAASDTKKEPSYRAEVAVLKGAGWTQLVRRLSPDEVRLIAEYGVLYNQLELGMFEGRAYPASQQELEDALQAREGFAEFVLVFKVPTFMIGRGNWSFGSQSFPGLVHLGGEKIPDDYGAGMSKAKSKIDFLRSLPTSQLGSLPAGYIDIKASRWANQRNLNKEKPSQSLEQNRAVNGLIDEIERLYPEYPSRKNIREAVFEKIFKFLKIKRIRGFDEEALKTVLAPGMTIDQLYQEVETSMREGLDWEITLDPNGHIQRVTASATVADQGQGSLEKPSGVLKVSATDTTARSEVRFAAVAASRLDSYAVNGRPSIAEIWNEIGDVLIKWGENGEKKTRAAVLVMVEEKLNKLLNSQAAKSSVDTGVVKLLMEAFREKLTSNRNGSERLVVGYQILNAEDLNRLAAGAREIAAQYQTNAITLLLQGSRELRRDAGKIVERSIHGAKVVPIVEIQDVNNPEVYFVGEQQKKLTFVATSLGTSVPQGIELVGESHDITPEEIPSPEDLLQAQVTQSFLLFMAAVELSDGKTTAAVLNKKLHNTVRHLSAAKIGKLPEVYQLRRINNQLRVVVSDNAVLSMLQLLTTAMTASREAQESA